MNENGLKKLDIILLGTLPIAAAIVSLIFKTNLLVSTMLFFGLPSAWLSYRTKSAIKKTAIFAAIFSILMTPMLDYVAVVNGVWVVSTVFPVKLFGTTPAEQFIWGFFFVYFLVIFYEHFFDKSKNEKINPRLKNFVIVFTILSLSFLFVVFINPNIIQIEYAYFWIAFIFGFIELILFLLVYPGLLSKFFKTTIYFFSLAVLVEFTGLKLNHWFFPKNTKFIGWVGLFGLKFPFEEFLFYFVMLAAMILTYYEFFVDDRK
ncbi:hypothetical protein A2567_01245 [Candidatus Azambacteria bacterium RIFOXYD1_FULL_42_11]|uniref:Lycopene cyclase domain-containing protein n=4 Tax=Candidatus Azamiibacteriota TaxID=1752741 RepID=A0A0G1C847_9BACT|nr:MAG: hypothetical protein UV07_C0014G0002 [Candidatus Azambacteria bacterium GW2011_GWB1_42_17]KKS45808.1 MAG: hypothetical protein UV10_C0013G0002 [Candidatus Azambacteria bacterium GW2011_GWA1_42_19]KKS75403.1 MAG: hypothetical protein UV48_C0013G0009 [Candidatus Azambacteria bacterium GW2011_GWA2_42_9]OGD42984.1 MAG: hypothetical protein A2567_01245 [Candidatus Azambacteria bacterium RIFOXYD1_FULL_42_11]